MTNDEQRAAPPAPECPRCGSPEVAPIAYGYPGAHMMDLAERGEIVLGGCVISPDSPTWLCRACEERFGALAAAPCRLRAQTGGSTHGDGGEGKREA